jgi:DNA-binding NarL/FixJ family response regulator
VKRPRVLLADDNKLLIERVTESLGSDFDVVGSADDGSELVSKALRLAPDVIVSDITMPRMTGIEAMQLLRGAGLQAKFVFLTIHSESEFLEACLDEGAVGYVLKTQMDSDLISAVNAAVRGKHFVSSVLVRRASQAN